MKRTNKIFLAVLVTVAILFFNSAYLFENTNNISPKEFKYSINYLAGYNFKQLRDTVYTDKDHFIEVNLAAQNAILYSRDGSEFHFPISSGTKRVLKGMDTKEGLFAIQWKTKILFLS